MKDGAQPPIADYALIGDCHSCALVSRTGSIDWACMPRLDAPSSFGRLLDWEKGGFCSITPAGGRWEHYRAYLEGTMVLTTTFTANSGEVRVTDFFAMRRGGREEPYHQLLRMVDGLRGRVDVRLLIVPRFDYGEVKPWLRRGGAGVFAAIGGHNGLLVGCDTDLELGADHELVARFALRAQERVRLTLTFVRPELLDLEEAAPPTAEEADGRLKETLEWWKRWSQQLTLEGPEAPRVLRSALVLKALTNAPTGAIAAAATTSLPERIGGSRNWDYRFSWIRDSSFSVRSLGEVGFNREADGFRRFIQRSAAGSAHDLQIMYGMGGERHLPEIVLAGLTGYRDSRPVRIGNAASDQLQLDAYGELMLLAYSWHRRGYSPDDDYWRFLFDLVETVAERWRQPDSGLWEIRGRPLHFVHSKVLCWAAVDRGVALAVECGRRAPLSRWRRLAREIRQAIEKSGYDHRRGVFVQAFGRKQMDASLLLLPSTGFVAYHDPRMVRTAEMVRKELEVDGMLRRYRPERLQDGLNQPEGVFVACTFWLAECLALQGQLEKAREYFDRAAALSNDVGLFSEEYDEAGQEMLGNFPQGLTHLSHIAAAAALTGAAKT